MRSSIACWSSICSFCSSISLCCLSSCCSMLVISAWTLALTTPLSAIATPSRIPMARARKTEIREMRWYLRSGIYLEAEEEPQLYGEYLEDVGQRVRGEDYRRDGHEAGDDERDELPDGDAGGVELAHTLGVDKARSYLQARQEGGGGPSAALVEELDKADVGTDGNYQLCAALLGYEDRHVFGEPWGGERASVLDASSLHPLHARRLAARIGVDEDVIGRPQAPVGDGIHVAEDQVRRPSSLEQGVRAAVYPYDKGPNLAQVGLECGQVLAVVVSP